MTNLDPQTLENIDKKLYKLTSVRHSFLRGVAGGLGSALGATIVLALIIGILVRLVQTAERLPLVGSYVEGIDIQQVVEPSGMN